MKRVRFFITGLGLVGLIVFLAGAPWSYGAPAKAPGDTELMMPSIIINAALSADPPSYVGACPATINFRGTISTNKAAVVKYKFIRSDGGETPVQTLNFSAAGSKPVSTTWSLGRDYTGWKAIKVISPVIVESNKANFSIRCKPVNLSVLAFKYEGRLVNAANFPPDRPLPVARGDSKRVDITIQNSPPTEANITESFSLGIYLSSTYPPGCRPTPIKLWSQAVPGLRKWESQSFSATVRIPASLAPGNYWMYPMVDDTNRIAETEEDGNCFTSVPLLVTVR
ncbi:MAG: hypothetical protein MUO24_02470 [Desulfobacterales bacterium]|nr:hypothetical protein [Desulfobacterales bacterium]